MMKISISKDNVNFNPVEVNSLQEFVDFATQYNYSTGIFKDNYRNKNNFLTAECIALDVDNEDETQHYSIEHAKQHFADYRHIIMPSKSHQKEKNGRIADRFRVILFLESTITDSKDFTATWGELLKFYPAADRACKDASRFYYPSPLAYSVNDQGRLWPVSTYVAPEPVEPVELGGERGQLAKSTMHFLLYGAPAGYRNARLFKAAKDMQEQGFTITECKARVSNMITTTGNWATSYLNETDTMTIENAYKNDALYQPRESDLVRPSPFKFETLQQMKDSAADVEWFIADLVPAAGFSIMSGEPKKGKSTLLRNLIKQTLDGGEFLGRKVKRGKVILFSFEEHKKTLAKQLETCGISPSDPNLMVHTGDVFSQDLISDLEEVILDFDPALVIVDTVFAMSNLESINNYKEVYDALKIYRYLGRKTNTSIIGVHHTNKMGRFLGSQAIYGVVDTKINFIAQGERRFIFSSGKDGDHFNDQELLFDKATETYSLGRVRERKADQL